MRYAHAPAAWWLLPPEDGTFAGFNVLLPIGLLVLAGLDKGRVELVRDMRRGHAVAVVHEPRRGEGHIREGNTWRQGLRLRFEGSGVG